MNEMEAGPGERDALDLPADRVRPAAGSGPVSTVELTLPATLAARVREAGAAGGASPFVTFASAFAILLQRSTGQHNVSIGVPATRDGRFERDPAIGEVLPLRVSIAAADTFETVTARVRVAATELHAPAGAPAGVSAQYAGAATAARHPHFDVSFDLQAPPAAPMRRSKLAVEIEAAGPQPMLLDLALTVESPSNGDLRCRFTYRSDLFERSTIALLAEHYGVLLASAADNPRESIACLAMASAAEMRTIVDVWSRPDPVASIVPPGGAAATLHALVTAVAAQAPTAPALVEDGTPPMSYAQLESSANRLAHALRARGVDRDVRVGVCLERSARTIVAMLAILKAGGAYVPLDPAHPPERIAFMLERADIATIVTSVQHAAAFAFSAAALLDIADPALATFAGDAPPAVSDDADSLAYVMFTSGSTGRPKAVATTHRGVVALVTKTPLLACTSDDTALLHASLGFDASVLMWAQLVYGARLAVMPAGPYSLDEFVAQLTRYRVTALDVSPALFHALVEERLAGLSGLTRCVVGGDVLSPDHCRRFVRALPACRLFNGYGPTEVTVAASFGEVRPDALDRRSVTVGRPAANSRLYVLDADRLPVAAGIAGELYVGGAGIARGYLNDPELTAERFVADPFSAEAAARLYRTGDRVRWLPNGELDFLGRADTQIKLRGVRIEPAEIEFALLHHPGVRHAVAVVRGVSEAERRLVAYVEVRDAALTEADLAAFLRTKLPAYTLPARLIVLDELPKNASGKLERRDLPDANDDLPRIGFPPNTASAERGTRDGEGRAAKLQCDGVADDERTLAELVARILGLERIAADANFFHAGGDSLRATRVLARVTDLFNVEISLRSFFAAPTVAGLAASIAHARAGRAASIDASACEASLDERGEAELDAQLRAEFAALVPPAQTAT